MGKLQLSHFFLLIYWAWVYSLVISLFLMNEVGSSLSETEGKHFRSAAIVSRNTSRDGGDNVLFRGNLRRFTRRGTGTTSSTPSTDLMLKNVDSMTLQRNMSDLDDNIGTDTRKVESVEINKKSTLQQSAKIAGVDKGGKQNPEDLIRNVLINHTLEHGGEQDLDKLVFSSLPQGKKLVLRTVRIIRTDENGEPIDEAEDAQPTYWDVTLANATDAGDGEEPDDVEEEIEESEEVEDEQEGSDKLASERRSSTNVQNITAQGKNKTDLESSGSHSAANYHHLNTYGGTGREKEHGKTNFHGNTHGNSHKHTYTVTDGKDVKPYHGTEKGLTDYANDQGNQNKDHGERFKTSKRKNKGRKVSGFKRVYHKEEFQRTEHFFDDEEANKIAESFGLSESKAGNNHGLKDDKRKYQGVHTEYLDGKKHENERGTHDGYNKGQQTTYKETEKHRLHNDYGKSMSHHHRQGGGGSSPQYHQHDTGYHPNHNYHGSHSTPRKNTVVHFPPSIADQMGRIRLRSNSKSQLRTQATPAIFAAPMATSFSVTEFAPIQTQSLVITTTERATTERENPTRDYEYPYPSEPSATEVTDSDNDYEAPDRERIIPTSRRPRKRKQQREREKKMFFSPKHRQLKEGDDDTKEGGGETTGKMNLGNFSSYPKDVTPYPTSSSIGGLREDIENEDREEKNSPYAPNFGPPKKHQKYSDDSQTNNNNEIVRPLQSPPLRQNFRRHKPWMWPPRPRPRRPRPESIGHHDHNRPHPTIQSSPATAIYPMLTSLNPLSHLASIPLRHANAYNKLVNRAKYQNYYFQQNPSQISYYELSTRKSDIGDEIENENTNPSQGKGKNKTRKHINADNDSAHFFNHNLRYAKNHLTSTIQPPNTDTSSNVIRNTLLEPSPGQYSTMIKVLPATMLAVNESSTAQSQNSVSAPVLGLPAPTRRPLSAAESISITTEYPILHYPQHQMVHHAPLHVPQQQVRPFIPKNNNWLTFSFNLGNPDFKLGNEFGPSQHPFGSNSHRVSKIMQGIKHGILRPLGRVAGFAQGSALGVPKILSPVHQTRQQVPVPLPPHAYRPQQYPYAPVILSQPPHPLMLPVFNRPATPLNLEMPHGPFPLSSKDQPKSVPPPATVSRINGNVGAVGQRPKFYYDFRPNIKGGNETGARTGTEASPNTNPTDTKTSRKGLYKPTLKVLSSAPTISTSTMASIRIKSSATSFNSSTTRSPTTKASVNRMGLNSESDSSASQSPPFINGIMDSVADFFGKMG